MVTIEVGCLSADTVCRKRISQIGSCENIDQIPTPGLFKNTWPKPLLCSYGSTLINRPDWRCGAAGSRTPLALRGNRPRRLMCLSRNAGWLCPILCGADVITFDLCERSYLSGTQTLSTGLLFSVGVARAANIIRERPGHWCRWPESNRPLCSYAHLPHKPDLHRHIVGTDVVPTGHIHTALL